MRVTVRLFASAAEAAGYREWSGEATEGRTVGSLVAELAAASPRFAELLPRCLLAVDREYVQGDAPLHDGAEVAVIPPVSGGEYEPLCRIQGDALEAAPLIAHVSHAGAGGVVVFYGNVRGVTDADETIRLEYEAYPEMAEAKLREIAAAASERWPGVRLAVAHRVGVLAPGETSVIVVASAPHRGDAFEASRYAIDQIKTIVPIWKKEVLKGGRTFWVDHA